MRRDSPANYLVIVRFSTKESPIAARQTEHAPLVVPILTRISERDSKPNVAFTSGGGETFGFLVRTKLNARAIYSQLESPGTNDPTSEKYYSKEGMLASPLTIYDQVLVVEIGNDYISARFPMQKDWLDRAAKQDLANLFVPKEPDAASLQRKLDAIKFELNEQDCTDRELLNRLLALVE